MRVLGRSFEETDLVAGGSGQAVQRRKGVRREVEMGVEVGQQEGEDAMRRVDIRGEERSVPIQDVWGPEGRREAEDVVFGYLDEKRLR